MAISKKAKTILLSCFALLLLSAGIFTTIHFIQANREIPTEEKPVIASYPCWTEYHIDNAAEDAVTIVYGTLGPKGETKAHEVVLPDGRVKVIEYYREAEIQVIQMIKGDPNAKTAHYLEIGGETEDAVYLVAGAAPLVEGQDYLLFLNKHGAYLSPATAIKVDEKGIITTSRDMRIQVEYEEQFRSNEPLPVSIDDYITEVEQYLD